MELKLLEPNFFLEDNEVLNNHDLLTEHDITLTINFTDSINDKIGDYNISYIDSRVLSRNEFINILNQVENIILTKPNDNILLTCKRGVNRSASIAMGLLIRNYSMDFSTVPAYIEELKSNCDTSWDN